MKKNADIVLGTCAIIFAIAIFKIGQDTGLRLFRAGIPGPGFLPYLTAAGISLCGLLLILGSLIKHVRAKEEKIENNPDFIWIFKRRDLWNFLVVLGTSALVVYGTTYLGLLTSLAIGVGIMAKLLGTPGWRTPIFVGTLSWGLFYVIFIIFLGTPLPRGIFGF